MKIKDCVVVDTTLIHNIIIKLDRYGYEKLANALDNNIKPLEPIVRDAWNCGEEIVQHEIHLDEFCHHNCDHINPKYVTIDQYINETEI